MTAIPLNQISTQPIERLSTGYDGLDWVLYKPTAHGHGACPMERYRSGLGFGRFVRFAKERVARRLLAAVEPFEGQDFSLLAASGHALRHQFRFDCGHRRYIQYERPLYG